MFNVDDPKAFREALAIIFRAAIAQDGEESAREKHKFVELFMRRFGLDHDAAVALYHHADSERDLDVAMQVLEEQLAGRDYERMLVMEAVNELIQADGTGATEYDLFELLERHLFPGALRKDDDL
jgi:hypothetical protein